MKLLKHIYDQLNPIKCVLSIHICLLMGWTSKKENMETLKFAIDRILQSLNISPQRKERKKKEEKWRRLWKFCCYLVYFLHILHTILFGTYIFMQQESDHLLTGQEVCTWFVKIWQTFNHGELHMKKMSEWNIKILWFIKSITNSIFISYDPSSSSSSSSTTKHVFTISCMLPHPTHLNAKLGRPYFLGF